MTKIIKDEIIELKFDERKNWGNKQPYGFDVHIEGKYQGTLLQEDQKIIRDVLNGYLQFHGFKIN